MNMTAMTGFRAGPARKNNAQSFLQIVLEHWNVFYSTCQCLVIERNDWNHDGMGQLLNQLLLNGGTAVQ